MRARRCGAHSGSRVMRGAGSPPRAGSWQCSTREGICFYRCSTTCSTAPGPLPRVSGVRSLVASGWARGRALRPRGGARRPSAVAAAARTRDLASEVLLYVLLKSSTHACAESTRSAASGPMRPSCCGSSSRRTGPVARRRGLRLPGLRDALSRRRKLGRSRDKWWDSGTALPAAFSMPTHTCCGAALARASPPTSRR